LYVVQALAAEVTSNFGKRLQPLGLSVRELTGDMQLSKKELAETQVRVNVGGLWLPSSWFCAHAFVLLRMHCLACSC
jgi:hypothetical protein